MTRPLGKPLNATLQRMCEALGVTGLPALADALEMPRSRVRNWHKRDNVPYSGIKEAAIRSKRPIEWFTEEQGASSGPAVPVRREAVDAALLNEVLEAVLFALDQRGLEMPSDKLARLVSLIYEHEEAQRAARAPVSNQGVRHQVERFLKLVA